MLNSFKRTNACFIIKRPDYGTIFRYWPNQGTQRRLEGASIAKEFENSLNKILKL